MEGVKIYVWKENCLIYLVKSLERFNLLYRMQINKSADL